jgi:hypothetical protein
VLKKKKKKKIKLKRSYRSGGRKATILHLRYSTNEMDHHLLEENMDGAKRWEGEGGVRRKETYARLVSAAGDEAAADGAAGT